MNRFGLAALTLCVGLGLASSSASADTITIFDINANILNGPYEGTDVITGTMTIDTTTGEGLGLDVTVSGLAETFDLFGGTCSSPNCTFIAPNPFTDYGELALGDTVGYTGGSLIPSSNPPSNVPGTSYIDLGSVAYAISGTLTPETAATPEPSTIGLMMGVGVLMAFVAYRRRRLA
jgi:hypothetical protein